MKTEKGISKLSIIRLLLAVLLVWGYTDKGKDWLMKQGFVKKAGIKLMVDGCRYRVGQWFK